MYWNKTYLHSRDTLLGTSVQKRQQLSTFRNVQDNLLKFKLRFRMSKITFSCSKEKLKEEMEEQKTLNTPLGSLTKRKRSLLIFVFWQSLPFLSIPCVCNVWKLKRGMRRQMRSKRLSDALVYRVLSFLREMTLERHSSQAWDVELGKGLTAEPWATKRSVSSSIVPWEQQKSVSTDRGVKWDEKQREGEMGKS